METLGTLFGGLVVLALVMAAAAAVVFCIVLVVSRLLTAVRDRANRGLE